MVMSTADKMETKLAMAIKLTFFNVLGSVQTRHTIIPAIPNTIVQVPYEVTTFIMMENVRIWLPMAKTRKRI